MASLSRAQQLAQQAINMGSSQNQFKQALEKAIGERTAYNKDLIEQQRGVEEELIGLPSQLRSRFMGGAIVNPLEQEAIISSRQGAIGGRLGTISDLLNARGQSYGNIIQNAMANRQAEADRLGRLAELESSMASRQMSSGGGGARGITQADIDRMRGGQSGATVAPSDIASKFKIGQIVPTAQPTQQSTMAQNPITRFLIGLGRNFIQPRRA